MILYYTFFALTSATSVSNLAHAFVSPVDELEATESLSGSDDQICEKPFAVICQTSDDQKEIKAKRLTALAKLRDDIRQRGIEATNQQFKIKDFSSFMAQDLPTLVPRFASARTLAERLGKEAKDATTLALTETIANGPLHLAAQQKIKEAENAVNERDRLIDRFDQFGFYVSSVRKQIFVLLSATGITEKLVNKRVGEFAKLISAMLPNYNVFGGEPPEYIKLQAKLAKQGTLNYSKIEGEHKMPFAINIFIQMCGVDGLTDNAFNAFGSILTICPGYLLSYFDQKSDGFELVLGHEIGHGIDANKEPKAYAEYLSCIETNHGADQFSSLAEYVSQTEKGIKDLEALIEVAKSKGNQNEVELMQRVKSYGSLDLDKYRLLRDGQAKDASRVLSHGAELSADYWGVELLASKIETINDRSEQIETLRSQLRTFCPGNGEKTPEHDYFKILYGDLKTDGLHPRGSFRIKNALGNPRIRAKLGCTTAPEKPWCGLK